MIFRGAIYEIKPPKESTGHEQQGRRYGVVIQSDAFARSTITVALTSTSAHRTIYRPEIDFLGTTTRVLMDGWATSWAPWISMRSKASTGRSCSNSRWPERTPTGAPPLRERPFASVSRGLWTTTCRAARPWRASRPCGACRRS
ncbi:type II toxin-antitoxin system PemK/MazF family toxin [Glycomyces sp. NPDC049804]|uniref:type II toxin-antitoxin system PemK/MazF family toxin n=1 Tax=Glycomyces sp. NPDC049804 TaxID=3154363 RepID=UPI00342DDA1E